MGFKIIICLLSSLDHGMKVSLQMTMTILMKQICNNSGPRSATARADDDKSYDDCDENDE